MPESQLTSEADAGFETAVAKVKTPREKKAKKGRDYKAEYQARKTRSGDPAPIEPRDETATPDDPSPKTKAIDPEQVAELLNYFTGLVCNRIGVTPLTKEEAIDGGKAFAPVLDHYFPDIAARVGIWGAPIYWVAVTFPPRINEYRQLQLSDELGKFNEGKKDPLAAVDVESKTPAHKTGAVVADTDGKG